MKLSPEDYIINYRKCLNTFIPKNITFDTFYMGRLGENKIFLPLKKSFNQSECKWLTIGIGGTCNAEKMFKQKYPNSAIFGIEPSKDQYANFMDFGTVIPFAVGAVNGSFNITVREGKKYKIIQMPVIALSDLLDKFLQTRIIHFMTIDIEGFEFNILQELLQNRILHNKGIVFCQASFSYFVIPFKYFTIAAD
uniref:Methyltransferase FkbM domain-containing protein n=1 Tax=Panagrolaimus davidi TaxID=227884 RepID=A0A914PDT5_9BILA